MFEECKTLAELNQARIDTIKTGVPVVLVNKAYAAKKALILSSQERGYKKVAFIKAELPKLEQQIGINAYWEDDNPYNLIVEEMRDE